MSVPPGEGGAVPQPSRAQTPCKSPSDPRTQARFRRHFVDSRGWRRRPRLWSCLTQDYSQTAISAPVTDPSSRTGPGRGVVPSRLDPSVGPPVPLTTYLYHW